MKDRNEVSIFNYLVSVILSSFFNRKNFYRLLLCSSVPLLFGSPSVASVTVEQQIAQVVTVGTINRPSLKVGSQGDAVNELQAALKLLGYYNGAVDGTYGQTTAAAVSQFKQSVGLAPDGIVDAATWQQLFPGQTITANNSTEETSSTTSTTNSTTTRNNFPAPNRSAADLPRPVVVSNQGASTTTATRRNAGNAQQLETVRVASTTRTTNTNTSRDNSSRSGARVQQSTSVTTTNNRGRSTTTNTTRTNVNNTNNTNTNNRGRSATRTTSTRNNTANRERSRTSNSTSTYRTRQTDPNLQKPGIQYTAAGFPILRLGMRGEEVYDLQTRLQRLGYLKNGPDGDFGADTEAAVKALQQRFGLQPDGVAGGETWEILTRRRTNRSQS